MKVCRKCGTEYDGDRCKPCKNQRMREHRKNNPESEKAATARWRANNKDKIKELSVSYYQKNKDRIKQKVAEYRAANPEKTAAAVTKCHRRNPEYLRIKRQNRRAKERGGKLSKGITQRLLILQKGRCAICRKDLNGKHHLDHIMPLKLNGEHDDKNIQLLCPACNLEKNAHHPVDFMQSKGYLL